MSALLPLVTAVVDLVEDGAVFVALGTFPRSSRGVLIVAAVAGTIKLTGFVCMVALLLFGVLYRVSDVPQEEVNVSVEDREENIHQTYLALRIAMIMLVAMLFLAILLQLWFVNGGKCWQTSISAYYFTSVRPVFVGVLCAIGACMIVYRGNTDYENTALDYSGFLAFIVAFVPTKIDEACLPVNGPDRPEIEAAVKTNVGALLVIGVAATIVGLIARRLHQGQLESPSLYTVISLVVTLGVLLFGIWLYWNERNWFLDHGHLYAAVPLFIGIIVVVVANAWTAPQGTFTVWYIAVAVAMVGSLLAGGILWRVGVQHWALWLEALIILWYTVFWIVQTAELRGAANRTQVG